MTTATTTPIKVGTMAPEFTLKDQQGNTVTLSSFRGRKNVLLVFYPASFTSVCNVQMPEYNKERQRLGDLQAQVLGISVDSVPVHKAFAEYVGGIEYPILADFYPHGATSQAYGVLRPEGFSERATFVIDKQGVVRYAEVHELTKLPDRAAAIEVLKSLS